MTIDIAPVVNPLIASCDTVTRRYDVSGTSVFAVDEVSFEVRRGKLLAIAGPSGSGKSTLLAIMGCLDRPTSGSVRVAEHELTLLGRRQRRSLRRSVVATMLPQPSENLLVARTGRANLMAAVKHRHGAPADIDPLIDEIGIGDFVDRLAGTMSGGEQQRLALACALVGGTPLVLADEPTGALDDANALQVVAALVQATGRGATIVAATHDPSVIEAADDVVWLDHGRRV